MLSRKTKFQASLKGSPVLNQSVDRASTVKGLSARVICALFPARKCVTKDEGQKSLAVCLTAQHRVISQNYYSLCTWTSVLLPKVKVWCETEVNQIYSKSGSKILTGP